VLWKIRNPHFYALVGAQGKWPSYHFYALVGAQGKWPYLATHFDLKSCSTLLILHGRTWYSTWIRGTVLIQYYIQTVSSTAVVFTSSHSGDRSD
jgi:hypothetical protein